MRFLQKDVSGPSTLAAFENNQLRQGMMCNVPPKKSKHGQSGLTIFELMITMAIVVILAGIAIPNFLQWRANAKFRSAVAQMTGDIQFAKGQAIRENTDVVIQFAANGYTIFVDNGNSGGTAGDGVRQTNEPLLKSHTFLSDDIRIDLSATTFSDKRTSFDPRGITNVNTGTVIVTGPAGNQASVVLNRMGRIKIS